MVRVSVVEGRVVVDGSRVVRSTLVTVEVLVLVGVSVTLNVAVGVSVTILGGPAMMLKVRIYAKVRPSITTIQSPDIIWFLSTTLLDSPLVTLLPECQQKVPILGMVHYQ